MSLSKSASLGIIACPGGETFVNDIIPHMKSIYRKRYEKMAQTLGQNYSLSREEVIERINFNNDLKAVEIGHKKQVHTFSPPDYLIPVRFTRFANGEFKAEINRSVRGMNLYIFQDVENHYPISISDSADKYVLSVNDHVLILFVTIDAALQAGAKSITAVLPVYPFSRQHKKKGREALTASWFGRVCESMGVVRIITLDIHSREIDNSFSKLRLENLHASYQILKKLMTLVNLASTDLVVVSPDTGAVDRNKFYAGSIQKPLALLYKERDYSRTSQNAEDTNITEMKLLGDVKDKDVFMADDMLGTGGTVIKAMKTLKSFGARRIICAVSLPLFSGDAIDRFDQAYKDGLFYRLIGTNGVYNPPELLEKEWYLCANVSNLFARIISNLHHGRSTSKLLDNRYIIQKLVTGQAVKYPEKE